MDEKEKYLAEIEAKLTRFDETINEIRFEMQRQREKRPKIKIEPAVQKHEKARAKLSSLEQADENSWQIFKKELDNLIKDIDEDLKGALAYFG
ncbi:MAG: hypothetical protein P8Y00_07650 [Deltaproteobacteria bacterium]